MACRSACSESSIGRRSSRPLMGEKPEGLYRLTGSLASTVRRLCWCGACKGVLEGSVRADGWDKISKDPICCGLDLSWKITSVICLT